MKQTELKRKKPLRAKRSMTNRRSAKPKPQGWMPVRTIRKNRQKRKPTAAEQRHLDAVAALRCFAKVERDVDGKKVKVRCGAPACCHHVRMGYGKAQRASHWETLPLCPYHHQNGPMGEGFHNGPDEWQRKHGTELELLHEVYAELKLAVDTIAELRRASGYKPKNELPPWWPSELRRRKMLEVYHDQPA